MRKLTKDDVEFTVNVYPEDTTYVGHCSAIDDETDAENESWIRDQLESGNDLAWCCVMVTATWRTFEGSDALGGVSCNNRKDLDQLIDDHGMYDEALADLNREVARAASVLAELNEGGV